MKSHLNETPFDELLGFHEECKRLVEKKYIKNKTVLDIGCGFGWCVWYLLNGGATRVKGIDISNELVAIARTIPDKRAEITVGSAIDLPYKKNTFDTVVSWETLEHIPKNTEPKMFRDVYKVLKPGGYFFFSTQHNNFFSTILDPAWWLIGHRHYSRDALIRFAETSGFTVEKIYLNQLTKTVLKRKLHFQ